MFTSIYIVSFHTVWGLQQYKYCPSFGRYLTSDIVTVGFFGQNHFREGYLLVGHFPAGDSPHSLLFVGFPFDVPGQPFSEMKPGKENWNITSSYGL